MRNQAPLVVIWPRGVTVSTLDSESSDRGSNPREASLAEALRATFGSQRLPFASPMCLYQAPFGYINFVFLRLSHFGARELPYTPSIQLIKQRSGAVVSVLGS